MRLKIVLGKSRQLSYYFIILFMVFAWMVLGGCEKKCADYEKELNAYADASKSTDIVEMMKASQEALAKCPNLAVAYEVMGDRDAKLSNIEDADKKYDKALALNGNARRINAKKDKISGALSKINSDAYDEKINSIRTMPLSAYAGLDESTRITWCEKAIKDPIKYIFTEYSITATSVPNFSGSPQQLDGKLKEYAAKEPTQQAGASAKIIFSDSGRGR
jgi:tetratricopeptide (TPR) repeat protein